MDARQFKTNSKVCQSLRKESFDALFMLISALVFYYVFSLLAKEDLFGPNSWDSYTLQSLAWLSGSNAITCRKPAGIWSVEKKVLHRKDMGMMM